MGIYTHGPPAGPPSSWRGPVRRRSPPPDLDKARREAWWHVAWALVFCALAVALPLLGVLLAA